MLDSKQRRRPTSLEEYRAIEILPKREEEEQKDQNFALEPTDVVITPYGKSGTTWLQQIVHGLRTRGDMDFDDISRVVPWLDKPHGVDLHAPQRGVPRAFKSHLDWETIPKGGRYIVSVRDPKDVMVSMYRFMEGWWFEPGSVAIEEYIREELLSELDSKGYWHHLHSWWPHRQDENVLMMAYEDMRVDLPGTVRVVARFCGIDLDEQLFELVVQQSSLPFMLAHKDRFDDYLIREWSEKVVGLPPGSDSAKVRKGEVGSHRYELPDDLSDELDQIWQREIGETLGYASYEELRAEIPLSV